MLLKQSYLLQGGVSFGFKNDSTQIALDNSTKITFEAFADVLSNVIIAYDQIPVGKQCPKEILKFSPPPQNGNCDQNIYRNLTTIQNYGLNISFHNVSISRRFHLKLLLFNGIFSINRIQNGFKTP